MMKRRKRTALAAVLTLVLALNMGALSAAAEESGDSEAPAVLQVAEKEITILDPNEAPKVPSGLRPVVINVDGRRAEAWAEDIEEQPEFVVFYGKMEDREPDFYRYDLVEKTYQRFAVPRQADTMEEYETLANEYNQLLEDYNDLNKENLMFKIMTAAAVLAAIV